MLGSAERTTLWRELAQAQDFRVDDPDGPVGIVDEIRAGKRSGEGTIVVACGWFGRDLLTLRFEDVETVVPEDERLIMRAGVPAVVEARRRRRPGGPGIFTRLRDMLEHTLRRRSA